ncbi:MAG: DUF2764 family protein [bacterium]
MNFNYYTVAALPTLTWDGELPCSFHELLDDFKIQFETLRDGISDILLLNDVKNLEILLRARLNVPEELKNNMYDGSRQYFRSRYVDPEELEEFIDEPFLKKPHPNYPEFMSNFLEKHSEAEKRVENIHEIYIGYFRYMQNRENGFLKYYGRIAAVMRTVLSAVRIIRSGKNLESELHGDPFIVETILENRSSSDFGLKLIFPEVSDLINLFDNEPLEMEHELDKLRFKLMEQVGRESPFADHIIYSYIIAFQLRNRWNTLEKNKGREFLKTIIEE